MLECSDLSQGLIQSVAVENLLSEYLFLMSTFGARAVKVGFYIGIQTYVVTVVFIAYD